MLKTVRTLSMILAVITVAIAAYTLVTKNYNYLLYGRIAGGLACVFLVLVFYLNWRNVHKKK